MERASSGHSNSLFDRNKSLMPQSYMCSVEYKSHFETGVIVEVEFPQCTPRTFFVTSFQVAPIINQDEIIYLRLFFKIVQLGNEI